MFIFLKRYFCVVELYLFVVVFFGIGEVWCVCCDRGGGVGFSLLIGVLSFLVWGLLGLVLCIGDISYF